MEQVELKPCAFCGGTDQEVGTNDCASWVTCADCGAQGPWHDVPGHDRDGAIAAWNTRRSPSADPALREALERIANYSGGTQYSTSHGMRGIAKDALVPPQGEGL